MPVDVLQQLMQMQQAQQQQIQELNNNFMKLNATLDKGKFPAVVEQNPNTTASSFSGNVKPCQAVTVLRNGKVIEKPTPPAHVPIAEEVEE